MTNQQAMRYWSCPPHTDIVETQSVLDWLMATPTKNSDEYIIEHDGLCIGKAGIWAKPELGYILHPAVWGKGVAYEALSALIPHHLPGFQICQC
ncbi:GNAT family N-acetyltransferase [Roseovarius phycicola]|uniref:GNAT family N-acetyltransferase n=1 Tax=Roseovarius phycicola TaxID=3080976 RepID=A0ABZ2HC36_9RHOB